MILQRRSFASIRVAEPWSAARIAALGSRHESPERLVLSTYDVAGKPNFDPLLRNQTVGSRGGCDPNTSDIAQSGDSRRTPRQLRCSKTHRFTLIELLVSMAVFSLVMIMLATMLYSTFMLARKRDQRARLAQTEQAVGDLLRRDFRNMVAGDGVGYDFSPINLNFMTNSGIGVDSSSRSPLTKVRYYVENGVLYRKMIMCDDLNVTTFFNGLPSDWSSATPHVVARGIDSVAVSAKLAGATVLSGSLLPEIITITIKFKDEWDSDQENEDDAYRTFVTHIFVDQRNQL